jgi:hypothetical protein
MKEILRELGVIGGVISFSTAAMVGVILCARGCGSSPRSYVNRPTANIQRVDQPEDGLAVFHDALRGVTCYEGDGHLACVPDLWLKPDASR